MTDPRDLTDAQLAAHLAYSAGRILLELRATGTLEGRALGDAGDRAANEYLVAALAELRPDDGILSEESKDTIARLSKDRVWIVDPVDGTREYGEGREDWAVHVGLAVEGAPAIGAVALPGRDMVLRTDEPVSLPAAPQRLRMVVSRSRPAAEALAVAEALDAQLVPMGSAGAKAMAVIRGDADIYLHTGGQYEWDNCAPAAVALAHGLHASRVDGSPLAYNREDTWLPDLLVCRREHADRILSLIANA
ncbi:3'(2'),5'-bisphosphate nucleotidase CysQ [Paraurantiacibacter namhicola]|uniref:3'-phosphoadenosine 5'-phosphate phosphatase n=1 Tax=Paraurantiacibacter namhicola TaxID=645517 RepID=A0A1C7D791_9SPHN|nr:3'(2'),5'-bisphosphate nucleotidase CysQ [Paraurantiacibacter namhicola]ANU07201.1 3'-phosphoadenosine 5'-phosphate phosphatase [Paraurantiacibacter namhicola]